MSAPAATVVIPMAGHGARFRQAGFTVPKPLIPVRGRPMYSWAVDSIPRTLIGRLVFVCLAEHLGDLGLEADIGQRYGDLDPVVVALDHVTDGQACTVLEASDHLEPDAPLIVFNADTYVVSDLDRTLAAAPDTVDGVIGVFRAAGDHWSFARTDDDGRVVETAEKVRISEWATTGLYHFRHAARFVEEAGRMVAEDDRTRGEFYVAPLYNRLIAQGADIRIDVARDVWVLGTPEELAVFEASGPR